MIVITMSFYDKTLLDKKELSHEIKAYSYMGRRANRLLSLPYTLPSIFFFSFCLLITVTILFKSR